MTRVPRALARAAVVLACMAACPAAFARDAFIANVDDTTSGTSGTFGFARVSDLFDSVSPTQFATELNYSCDTVPAVSCDAVTAAIDFRGVPVSLDFPANSASLTFQVPELGFSHTFTGNGTTRTQARADAIAQLNSFVKTDPRFLRSFLTLLARESPIDPLAGNPASLFAKWQAMDFDEGFTRNLSLLPPPRASDARAAGIAASNEFAAGLDYQNVRAPSSGGAYGTNSLDLPLSYTVNFYGAPGHKLRFDLPIMLADSGGAKSYATGLGIAYTLPAADDWALTPAIGVGAAGSADLGGAGGLRAFSLTSSYTFHLGGMALGVGDAVGRYSSFGLRIGGIEADPDVSQTVFTNGLLLTGPLDARAGGQFLMEYSLTDARATGSAVYARHQDEIGVALGHVAVDQGVITSHLRAGLGYVFGDRSITALRFNLISRF